MILTRIGQLAPGGRFVGINRIGNSCYPLRRKTSPFMAGISGANGNAVSKSFRK